MELQDIHIRDPFILIENGKTYLYRTLSQGDEENGSGFCVFVSDDGVHYNKKVIYQKTPNFWGEKEYWAPEVHKIDGKFYLFASFAREGSHRASHIFVCDTPDGTFAPLENPLTPLQWDCLDATYYEENGKRYTVFCHEWAQCKDGEMLLAELDENLTIKGEVKRLFSASKAPWVRAYSPENYVTDGPFLYKLKSEKLLMLWSSFGENGYAIGMATADTVEGEWTHAKTPLVAENGGHGMLFERDGKLYLVYHVPNAPSGEERARIVEVRETFDGVEIVI